MQCIDITPKSLQMVSFIGLIAHRFERFLTSSPAIPTPKRRSSNRCAIPISYRPSFPPQSGVRRIDAQSPSVIARQSTVRRLVHRIDERIDLLNPLRNPKFLIHRSQLSTLRKRNHVLMNREQEPRIFGHDAPRPKRLMISLIYRNEMAIDGVCFVWTIQTAIDLAIKPRNQRKRSRPNIHNPKATCAFVRLAQCPHGLIVLPLDVLQISRIGQTSRN